MSETAAGKSKGTELVERSRNELMHELFTDMFDSLLEQSQMTPEQQSALAQYLENGQSDAPLPVLAKRDTCAMFMARWEAEAEFIRAQEIQLAARRHEIEKVIRCLKESIRIQMENWGVRKVEGRVHRFSIRKNPPRVEIYDEAVLPGEFLNYEPKPDKLAIAAALEAGREVPGARWADATTRLEVK